MPHTLASRARPRSQKLTSALNSHPQGTVTLGFRRPFVLASFSKSAALLQQSPGTGSVRCKTKTWIMLPLEREYCDANGGNRAPGTDFAASFAQGLCPSISTLRLNLSRAILGRGSNKPERRHRGHHCSCGRGSPLNQTNVLPRDSCEMTPTHSPQLSNSSPLCHPLHCQLSCVFSRSPAPIQINQFLVRQSSLFRQSLEVVHDSDSS